MRSGGSDLRRGPPNKSLEGTREGESTKLIRRRARRSAQPIERMNRSSTATRLGLLFAFSLALAQAHTVEVPDKIITLELPDHHVEQLATRIDAALVAHGFERKSASRRLTLDMRELPTSASPEEGIILSEFEKTAAIRIGVQVTRCRAVVAMSLADDISRANGEVQLRLAQESLVGALSSRKKMPLIVTDGIGGREDPCVVVVRSNKSLERTREG
jgi:hypothetical protein